MYGYSVTFEGNFFTNSVFADTYSEYGTWGWLYTILAYGFAGYAFARMFSFSPVIAASAGVVAYCFLEVWRVQILTTASSSSCLLLTARSVVPGVAGSRTTTSAYLQVIAESCAVAESTFRLWMANGARRTIAAALPSANSCTAIQELGAAGQSTSMLVDDAVGAVERNAGCRGARRLFRLADRHAQPVDG